MRICDKTDAGYAVLVRGCWRLGSAAWYADVDKKAVERYRLEVFGSLAQRTAVVGRIELMVWCLQQEGRRPRIASGKRGDSPMA